MIWNIENLNMDIFFTDACTCIVSFSDSGGGILGSASAIV